jgi:hypothetical protein
MVPLSLGRLLEASHVNALRVHSLDHMPAGPVLAGAIDPLQYDQKRVAAVGIKGAL